MTQVCNYLVLTIITRFALERGLHIGVGSFGALGTLVVLHVQVVTSGTFAAELSNLQQREFRVSYNFATSRHLKTYTFS